MDIQMKGQNKNRAPPMGQYMTISGWVSTHQYLGQIYSLNNQHTQVLTCAQAQSANTHQREVIPKLRGGKQPYSIHSLKLMHIHFKCYQDIQNNYLEMAHIKEEKGSKLSSFTNHFNFIYTTIKFHQKIQNGNLVYIGSHKKALKY